MAGNQVTLTLGGDATQLQRAAQQASQAMDGVADSVTTSGRQMTAAATETEGLGARMGHLGSAVDGATTAIDSVGQSLTALSDIQNMAANKAAKQARLTADVEQAQIDQRQAAEDLRQANLDLTQSYLDGDQALVDSKQAAIDIKQATLDASEATKALATAQKENGKGSAEAAQAAIDLDQATADLAQAQLDQKQAQQDANQYTADGRQAMLDAAQAVRDGKDATLDLNDAMREAEPGALKEWANNLEMVTPLITAAVGLIGLVTAAQWLWNASLWASPVTWIVIAIAAVVVGIVLLATHTKELGEVWDMVWGGISDAASWAWDKIKAGGSAVWDWMVRWWEGFAKLPGQLKAAFSVVGGYIVMPFRNAFNTVSDAWNATIGKLHWSVPGWVPGIGGNSISAPKLPRFHQGGVVPGGLGSETLAILQAGERVSPAGGGGHSEITVTVELVGDGVLRVVRAEVGRRGSVERALGGDRG